MQVGTMWVVAIVYVGTAWASLGWDNCTEHFHLGLSPSYVNESISICRGGYYAISYDPKFQNPSWAAYRITQANTRANIAGRVASFHRDPDLVSIGAANPSPSSSAFSSEWNRGHLAPSQILSYTDDAKYQTYTTSNVAPQWWQFNQQPWQDQEQAIFDWINESTDASAELYIVTGVGYANREAVEKVDNIATPSYYFAALCDPKTNESVAFLGLNQQDGGGLLKAYRSVADVAGTVFCGATLNATRGGDVNGSFEIFGGSCGNSSVNASHWNFRGYAVYSEYAGVNCSNATSRPALSPGVGSDASGSSSTSSSGSNLGSSASQGSGSSSSSSASSLSASGASVGSSTSNQGASGSGSSSSQGDASSASGSADGSSSSLSASGSSLGSGSTGAAPSTETPNSDPPTAEPPTPTTDSPVASEPPQLKVYFMMRLSGRHWASLLADAATIRATVQAAEDDIRSILLHSDLVYVESENVMPLVTSVAAGSLIVNFIVSADLRSGNLGSQYRTLRGFSERSLAASGVYRASYGNLDAQYKSAALTAGLISDASEADAVVCMELRLVQDTPGVPSSNLAPTARCTTSCIVGLAFAGTALIVGLSVVVLLVLRGRSTAHHSRTKKEPVSR